MGSTDGKRYPWGAAFAVGAAAVAFAMSVGVARLSPHGIWGHIDGVKRGFILLSGLVCIGLRVGKPQLSPRVKIGALALTLAATVAANLASFAGANASLGPFAQRVLAGPTLFAATNGHHQPDLPASRLYFLFRNAFRGKTLFASAVSAGKLFDATNLGYFNVDTMISPPAFDDVLATEALAAIETGPHEVFAHDIYGVAQYRIVLQGSEADLLAAKAVRIYRDAGATTFALVPEATQGAGTPVGTGKDDLALKIRQILVLIALGVGGILLSRPLRLSTGERIAAGPALATLAWVGIGALSMIAHVPLGASWIAAFVALALGVACRRGWPRDLARPLVIGALLYLAVATLFCFVNVATTTNDSFWYIERAGALVRLGVLDDTLVNDFKDVGIAVVLVEAVPNVWGFDFFHAFAPFLSLFSLGIAYRGLLELLGARRLPASLAVLAYGSQAFVVFVSSYVHTHAIAIAFIWLFLFGLIRVEAGESRSTSVSLLFLGLAGFGLSRIEAPLVVALMYLGVAPLLFSEALRETRRSVVVLALPAAWMGYLYLARGREDAKVLLSAAALVALIAWPYLPAKVRGLSRLRDAALAVLGAGLVALAVSRSEHLMASFQNMWLNLVQFPYWGLLWIWVGVGVASALTRRLRRLEAMTLFMTVGYGLYVLVVTWFREPYRDGFGDSGNRMMSHILPVAVVFLLAQFANPRSQLD